MRVRCKQCNKLNVTIELGVPGPRKQFCKKCANERWLKSIRTAQKKARKAMYADRVCLDCGKKIPQMRHGRVLRCNRCASISIKEKNRTNKRYKRTRDNPEFWKVKECVMCHNRFNMYYAQKYCNNCKSIHDRAYRRAQYKERRQ